jgi:hypothetical protein
MADQSTWVFETPDYEGTPVVLSQTTWHAKAGNDESGSHPEIREYLEEVRTTITSPDLGFQSTRDERSRIFYRLGAGRENLSGKHVVVVVKYVQETTGKRGYVGTIYLSRAVYSRGVQLWPKLANIPQ